MSVTSLFPVPVPTPYQPPSAGGNPAVPAGTEGRYVPSNQPYYQNATFVGPTWGQPVASSGNTLEQQTQAPVPQPQQTQNTGGDWGSIYNSQYKGWDEAAARADWQAKGSPTSFGGDQGGGAPSIDYGPYFAQLDQQLGLAQGSKASGEATVGSQYQTGLGDLNLSNEQQQAILDKQRAETQTNKASTLKDISTNLRNSFMAGNIYLGARGAGDSSAANQYSYALTKLGNQQRGDVQSQTATIMADIDSRESNLASVYQNEQKKLAAARDEGIRQVGEWFAGVQQQLAGLKGEALRNQSEQAYNIAINELNRVKTEAANLSSKLQDWALNNSKTLQEARANLSGIAATGYNQPQAQPLTSTPVVTGADVTVPAYGGGAPTQDKTKNLFDQYNMSSPNWQFSPNRGY
jgi:hypothetical protein